MSLLAKQLTFPIGKQNEVKKLSLKLIITPSGVFGEERILLTISSQLF
jgi:hypothetical protein